MGRFLTGFDTISYYVPTVFNWIHNGASVFEVSASAPLFYGLLIGLGASGISSVLAIKTLSPVLLGSLGLAIYFYASKALIWSSKKSLAVSLLATLYFVSLRISWDMLRTELAMILLFVFFLLLHGYSSSSGRTWKSSLLLSFIMVMVALSEQLVSLIMFVVLLSAVFVMFRRRSLADLRSLVLSAIPSFIVFGFGVYSNYVFSPGAMSLGFPSASLGGWFSLFGFNSPIEMIANIVAFILFCYFPLLPFLLLGFRRFKTLELQVWVAFCLGAALLSFINPLSLIVAGYRWVLLLVFPLAFFTVEMFSRLNHRNIRKVFVGALIFLSCSFMLLPAQLAFPYFTLFSNYVPTSMLQNSVPLSDCEDVVMALSWYGQNIGSNGTLLVHQAFSGWADLYLNANCKVVNYGYENPQVAAGKLLANGLELVYVIWWVPGEGWHGLSSMPSSFYEVFHSGRIAVYEYNSTAQTFSLG